jgi:hypothetical protein
MIFKLYLPSGATSVFIISEVVVEALAQVLAPSEAEVRTCALYGCSLRLHSSMPDSTDNRATKTNAILDQNNINQPF